MTVNVPKFGRDVFLDGMKLQHITELLFDPNYGKYLESVEVHDHNHDVDIVIHQIVTGSLKTIAESRGDANIPIDFLDLINRPRGRTEFDTSTEEIVFTDENVSNYRAGYGQPQRTVETRQTEATASHSISDSGAVDEAWAQQVICSGSSELKRLILKLVTESGSPVSAFDLEIWSDSGNLPDAKLSGSNTVTIHASAGTDDATNYYLGHALASAASPTYNDADWETIEFSTSDATLINTATISVGTKYWIVIRNVQGANDNLFVCYTESSDLQDLPCKQDDDVGNSPAWGDAPSGADALTFVVQWTTLAGFELEVRDYLDAARTSYMKHVFHEVRFFSDNGLEFSPKESTKIPTRWSSQSFDAPTIV